MRKSQRLEKSLLLFFSWPLLTSVALAQDIPQVLGTPVDGQILQALAGSCLQSDARNQVFLGGPHASFSTLEQQSFRRLVRSTWAEGSLRLGIPSFLAGQLTLRFLAEQARTHLSTAVVTRFGYQAGHLTLVDPKPRKEALQRSQILAMARRALQVDPDDIEAQRRVAEAEEALLQLCGDHFVRSVPLGGELMLGMRFVFQNKEDALKFQAIFKMWLFFFTITKTWEANWYSQTPSFDLILSAHQRGGDPKALQAQLEKPLTCRYRRGARSNQGLYDLDEIRRCHQAYSRLTDYAKNGFRRQLSKAYRNQDAKALAPMGAQLARYDEGGLYSIQVEQGQTSSEAHERLGQLKELKVSWEAWRQVLQEIKGPNQDTEAIARHLAKIDQIISHCQKALKIVDEAHQSACLDEQILRQDQELEALLATKEM